MKEIDIIIPVYNAENSLFNCLASISCQTLIDKITVTLIQDGDGKDYSKIIKVFEDKIDIKLIKLEKNSGPGIAREIGIQNTNNEFIIFCDADDMFFCNLSVEYLYTNIKEKNNNITCSYFLGESINDKNEKEYIEYTDVNVWLFAKIYKRNFIKNNNIHFSNTKYNEDIFFIMQCESFCDNNDFLMVERFTYLWKYNENSLTRYKNTEQKHEICLKALEAQINNTIEYFNWLMTKIKFTELNEIHIEWLFSLIFKLYLDYQRLFYEEDKDFFNLYKQTLKQLLKQYLKVIYYPIKNLLNEDEINTIYSRITYSYALKSEEGKRYKPICSFDDFIQFIEA